MAGPVPEDTGQLGAAPEAGGWNLAERLRSALTPELAVALVEVHDRAVEARRWPPGHAVARAQGRLEGMAAAVGLLVGVPGVVVARALVAAPTGTGIRRDPSSTGGDGLRHELRDQLGRVVREAWIAWAAEQPHPKPSHLVPWEQMAEPDREADRRIGEAVAAWFGEDG